MKENILIVLEGISGSGKSSVLAEVLEGVKGQSYEISYFKWNQVAFVKKMLGFFQKHNIIIPSIYALLEWMGFFIGYRKLNMKGKKNQIYICDRYLYTGITRERTNQAIIKIGILFLKFCKKPDLVVFMDTRPEVCLERIHKRGKHLFCQNKWMQKNLDTERELLYLKQSKREYEKLFDKLEQKDMVPVYKVKEHSDHDSLVHAIQKMIGKKGE